MMPPLNRNLSFCFVFYWVILFLFIGWERNRDVDVVPTSPMYQPLLKMVLNFWKKLGYLSKFNNFLNKSSLKKHL